MNVKIYDKASTANTHVTENQTVGELSCPCPICKTTLIDVDMAVKEQACRDYFGQPIYHNHWYRCPAYNKQINGDPDSWHMDGRGTDKDVGAGKTQVDPRIVAMYDDAIGQYGGIGLYMYADGRSWVHNDSGARGNYWISKRPGSKTYVKTFLPVLTRNYVVYPVKFEVIVLQHLLNRCTGYAFQIAEDGKFGKVTATRLNTFKKAHGLSQNGIVDRVTWIALFKTSGNW